MMPTETRRQLVQADSVAEIARARVRAAWDCVGVLCPDSDLRKRKNLTNAILRLVREEPEPRTEISDPQVVEMVWRNMQCIQHHCPLLVFSRQLSEELNEFFNPTR